MRQSNRMKRILREQWGQFLPVHAQTRPVTSARVNLVAVAVQRFPQIVRGVSRGRLAGWKF